MELSMAEGESAIFDLLSFDNAGITKYVVQMYPLMYPQMFGLGGIFFQSNEHCSKMPCIVRSKY